ncbi:glycosyltransferase [Halobacteriaceae archaeon GCM10025711]
MGEVAVLHNTLDLRGGADAVCLHVCAALDADHDVTLYTISETDPGDLASRFDLAVDVSVRSPPGSTVAARTLAALAPYAGPQLAARSALLAGFFRREAPAYDLAVSTANEFDLPIPSVQYVHFPQFYRSAHEDDPGRLNDLWSRLAGPTDRRLPADATLLANSEWTASVTESIYGRRPTVLHPPVDPVPDPHPWADREDGVVVLGRLAPDKRVLAAIEVVDRVRDRGHDVHLHVVGTAAAAYRTYVARVERAAARRPYVYLERDVSRDRVEDLLRRHRYGLNAKPREHFGMALAEFVAAGMVAFAPDGGGQRDVLDGRADRLFTSVEEAADLVAAAIEGDARPSLPPDRFGRDRFHDAVRAHVDRTIERRPQRETPVTQL